jgi:hypothetical protein
VVDRIDHVDDGVAVAVVFGPYGADAALAAEIPELEHCRGQRDLPGCTQKTYIQYYLYNIGGTGTHTVLTHCRGNFIWR